MAALALSTIAFGYEPPGMGNAVKCEKDLGHSYSFFETHIANTPDPQLTLDTGLYWNKNAERYETYRELLSRIASYAVGNC